MNVRKGDFARIVRSQHHENLQKIVHVERACGCSGGASWWVCKTMQPVLGPFFVGGPLLMRIPAGAEVHIHDSALRRLYDGDAADETLRFAGKPLEAPVDFVRDLTARV